MASTRTISATNAFNGLAEGDLGQQIFASIACDPAACSACESAPRRKSTTAMHASLYPTFEYSVRALRLRRQGLSATAIESCTGIPHNLQEALIPSAAIHSSATPLEVDAIARESARTISIEELNLIQAAIQCWTAEHMRLPFAQRGMPIIVALDEVMRRVRMPAEATKVTRGDILGTWEHLVEAESSISLALRLMERNGLNWDAARNSIKVTLPRTPGQYGAKVSIVFDANFNQVEWVRTRDQQLIASLPHTSGVLLRRDFAFCPECLAGRFHSVAHQMNFLNECVIHKRPLIHSCTHCNTPVGTVEVMLKRGWEAYRCKKCEKPLCGKMLNAASQRLFRETLKDGDAKLRPLTHWLEHAQQRLWPLEQVLTQNASSVTDWGEWGCTGHSLLNLANGLHPFPADYKNPGGLDIELLQWSNRLGASMLHTSAAQAERFDITAIYASSLRAIGAWRHSFGSLPLSNRPFDALMSNSITRPDEAEARDLALAYFRTCFEDAPPISADWTTVRPSLSKCRITCTPHPASHKHRLPAKALMIGAFATALSAVEIRRAEGVQRSKLEWLRPGRGVPLAILPEIGGPAKRLAFTEGVVVAPVTQSFPAKLVYLNRV